MARYRAEDKEFIDSLRMKDQPELAQLAQQMEQQLQWVRAAIRRKNALTEKAYRMVIKQGEEAERRRLSPTVMDVFGPKRPVG